MTKVLGHRVHPMAVVLPLGLLAGSVGFDVTYLVSGNAFWAEMSFWLLVSGIVTGCIAAPFGTLDWWFVESGTRAKRVGLSHGIAAVTALALFAVSLWWRWDTPASPAGPALGLSALAFVVMGLAGWLGGELVERLAIGVDRGAHANAPSSLTHRDATDRVASS